MRRGLPIGIMILFTGLYGLAQTGHFVFTNYTTAQGLPDNNIQCMMQDSRGFLWIATTEGLSRFDGRNFKNFYAKKNDTIVQSNQFSVIYEYKKGHLLLGNFNRYICFDTYTDKFYLSDISGITNGYLNKLPGENTYYLGKVNKIYIINANLRVTDSIISPDHRGNNVLNSYGLKPGLVLLQSLDKYYLYHTTAKKIEPLPINFNFSGKVYIPYFRYYDTVKQQLYFSEYQLGLYRYSLATQQTEYPVKNAAGEYFVNSFVYQAVPREDSTVWFLTASGIRILNNRTGLITTITTVNGKNTSLISNAAYTSCTDKDHNFWIGTNNGISKLNANALSIKSYADGLEVPNGSGLMSLVKGADGNMYVSSYMARAYELNMRTQTITALQHPLNTGNWNLFVKGDEIIRTGVGNTLLAFNTRSRKFTEQRFLQPWFPAVELVVLGFVHSNGDEWYSGNRGGGFVRKLAGSGTIKTYKRDDGVNKFDNAYYTCYTEDKQGDLWFGVNKTHQLLHWNLAADRFNEINFFAIKGTEKVAHAGINAVTHDADNNIWVGFNGSGLVKYMPRTNSAISYTIADGLPSNLITGLSFDKKNRLWLSTPKGLSCFVISENKFINFKKEDGLPADDFTEYCNYFDTATNRLWVGSNSVLMQFNPDLLLAVSKEKFPVYTDEIYINGKRYEATVQNNLQLKSWENNLQFHFTGVDLDKGKDIEYDYRLEGADGEWNATGTNQTASYANLKPGKYTFRVRARHKGDNQWNEAEEPLHFTVATPWSRSWWFLALVALATAGMIWYLIKNYYARRLEQERALLEKQKAVEQERTRIATDMHDDFGASLSRIKFLSEKIKLKGQADTGLQDDLTKISGFSDEMAEKMGEIVWALNQKYDTLGDLVSFCRSYASEYLEAHHIALHFEESVTERQLPGETRRNLFLVLKESLYNTVKHSGANAVRIGFKEMQNQLFMHIQDNGKGMDRANIRPFANGLENMKKRIADCGGQVALYNQAGMVVQIQIPLSGQMV